MFWEIFPPNIGMFIFFQNCQPDDAPCPCVYLERVGFEMDKKYLETKLEVLASPAVLIASDAFQVYTNSYILIIFY